MGRFIAFLSALLILGASRAGRPFREAAMWPGCAAFATQPEAQAYWESQGRPVITDADGDGKVCKRLLDGGENGSGCVRSRETVTLPLSRARYPEATLHFEVAWQHGITRRYTIARDRAKRNRAGWQRYVPAGVDADGDGRRSCRAARRACRQSPGR